MEMRPRGWQAGRDRSPSRSHGSLSLAAGRPGSRRASTALFMQTDSTVNCATDKSPRGSGRAKGVESMSILYTHSPSNY